MHRLSESELAACSPVGDAQLRNSGEQEEHGQPERALFNGGGSYEVKHPSQCRVVGNPNVSVSPASGRSQKDGTEIYISCLHYGPVSCGRAEQR